MSTREKTDVKTYKLILPPFQMFHVKKHLFQFSNSMFHVKKTMHRTFVKILNFENSGI